MYCVLSAPYLGPGSGEPFGRALLLGHLTRSKILVLGLVFASGVVHFDDRRAVEEAAEDAARLDAFAALHRTLEGKKRISK